MKFIDINMHIKDILYKQETIGEKKGYLTLKFLSRDDWKGSKNNLKKKPHLG